MPTDPVLTVESLVADAVTTTVLGCARCGETHPDVTFRRLQRPVTARGHILSHWVQCPTTGQPILLGPTDEP